MTGRAKTIAYGLFLILAFSAGWIVNGWRFDSVISGIKTEHAAQVAINANKALERYETMERTKNDAIKAAQERETQFKADAGRAAAASDSLRKQLSSVPARIATASRASVDQYATSAGDLLAECGREAATLAEKADGHASDVRLMLEAWPR